jgi:sugar phosphate isomerase/epimerase
MTDKKYKIGLSTAVDLTVAIERQFELFSKNKIDFVSLCAVPDHSGFFDYDKISRTFKLADSLNLSIDSVHVPFNPPYNLAAMDSYEREVALERTAVYIERATALKIPIAIIHPHHYFYDSKEACLERCIGALERLHGRVGRLSITVAIENMPTSQGSWICDRILENFGPELFGFCFDSSHENMSGEPFHLLKKYYSRMTTCHLSDNHGRADEHLPPYDGNIDWPLLRKYFDKATQMSNILFEVGTGQKLSEPIEIFIERAAKTARSIFG